MKRYLLRIIPLLMIGIISQALRAQEYPVYNQYYFNYYLTNPALAGANDCHYFMLTHKQQWMGIEDAPLTTSISYQGRLPKNVGLGAYFYHDQNGYSMQQGGQISVAYHIPLSDGMKYRKAISKDRQLSFAVSAKLFNYGFRETSELRSDPRSFNDYAMQDLESKLSFNMNVGAYFTSYGFFTGLSFTNLVPTKMKAYNKSEEPEIPMSGYFILGNDFEISRLESIEPSLLYKFDISGNMGLDVSLRYSREAAKTKNFSYWLQLTYRQTFDVGPEDSKYIKQYQAIDILPVVGFSFGKFHLGLAYDICLNDLWRYNFGSLELMLGYTLCYTKRFCR